MHASAVLVYVHSQIVLHAADSICAQRTPVAAEAAQSPQLDSLVVMFSCPALRVVLQEAAFCFVAVKLL